MAPSDAASHLRSPAVSERRALGKRAREAVPRKAHAVWRPPAGRADPVGILERQAETRLPELLPIRYGRMSQSPFAFFRGAAAIMAADLATTPRSGFVTQLCGDAHLSNFGGLRRTRSAAPLRPQRLRRDAPGTVGVGCQAARGKPGGRGPQRGPGSSQRRAAVTAAARAYREAMRDFAAMGNLDVWYSRLQRRGHPRDGPRAR